MMVRLPVPPSTNNLFANGKSGRYVTASYKAWRTAAGWQLNLARVEPFGKMKVAVTLYVPRKPASRDLDNFSKAPLDLLVAHGVIADDKHVERLVIERHDAPEIILSVEPFGEPTLEARRTAAGMVP